MTLFNRRKPDPMKVKTILLILTAVMLSVLLSGCTGAAMQSNSWAGLTTDAEKAYLANGTFVHAINLNNGSQSWQYPADKADAKESFFAAPVLVNEAQLIIASSGANHSLLSLDPKNGMVNWVYTSAEGGWLASPLVENDVIYAPNADGKLYVFNLDGKLLWDVTLEGQLWGQPVSDGEYIYLTSLEHYLFAVDLQSHEIVWQFELCGATPGGAALDEDGTLYVGSFGDTLAAIDSANGSIVWKAATNGWIWNAVALEEDTLYFGDLEGYFYALDTANGESRWNPIQPDGPIVGTPLVMDDFIVIGTESGVAYAIDRDGKTVWTQNIGGRLYSTPAQNGEYILFSLMESDYALVALDFDGKQVWQFTPAK